MGSDFGFEYDCLKGTFFTCSVCNYAWRSRTSGSEPRSCPNCGTRLWKQSHMHCCTQCGHSWASSLANPRKCPQCQSSRWNEGGGTSEKAVLSVAERESVLSRYRAGIGAVKISIETGITFSDVYDVISESDPGSDVIL